MTLQARAIGSAVSTARRIAELYTAAAPVVFKKSPSSSAWRSPAALKPISDSAPWKRSGAAVSAWRASSTRVCCNALLLAFGA